MKTCEDCGSRVYEHGCVNCDELVYIQNQEGYEPPTQPENPGHPDDPYSNASDESDLTDIPNFGGS